MEVHGHLGNKGFSTGGRDSHKEVLSIKNPLLDALRLRRIEFTDPG